TLRGRSGADEGEDGGAGVGKLEGGAELAGVLLGELLDARAGRAVGVLEGLEREVDAGEGARDGGDAERGNEAEVDDAVLAGEPGERFAADGVGVFDLAARLVDREGARHLEQRVAGELVLLALLRGGREAALDEEEVDRFLDPFAAGAADDFADPRAAGGAERMEEPLELAGGP